MLCVSVLLAVLNLTVGAATCRVEEEDLVVNGGGTSGCVSSWFIS